MLNKGCFVTRGENYSNNYAFMCGCTFILKTEKNLRFQKYPDTCGQGLNVCYAFRVWSLQESCPYISKGWGSISE